MKDKPTLEPKKVTQSLTHAVNTAVNSAITSQVERCVKNEFKRTVTPGEMQIDTNYNYKFFYSFATF